MILASGPLSGDALTALVAFAYCAAATIGGRGKPAWRFVEVIAWVLHGTLLAHGLLGPAPRFGFAAALSMTVWLVLAVYFVERQFYPQLRIRWVMSALGAAAVVVAWMFPGNPLSAGLSVWLPLHLSLALGSYGLFGAAVAHALLMGRAESRMRNPSGQDQGMPLLTMERLTFRLVWPVLRCSARRFCWPSRSVKPCTARVVLFSGTTRPCSPCCRGWCLPHC